MLNRIHDFSKTVGASIYGALKRYGIFERKFFLFGKRNIAVNKTGVANTDSVMGAMNRAPTCKRGLLSTLLISIFSLFIIATFFRNHLNYSSSTSWQSLVLAIPTFIITFLASLPFLFFIRRKISVIKILFLLFFTTFLTFCTFGLINNLFVEVSVFEMISRIGGTLFVFFSVATLFTIFLTSIGEGVFTSLSKIKISLLEKFVFGFAIFACFLWGIARFGFFNIEILTAVFFIFFIAFFRNSISILRDFLTQKTKITALEIVLGAVFFAVTSHNFLHHFLPFALGWDTSTEYFLTIKNLLATGVLRNGILPAATETVLTSGSLFFGLSFSSFLLIFWGSFLPIFIISFAKKIGISRSKSVVFALAFLLIPAVQFQLSKDLKLDIILLETILVALILWHRKVFNLSAFLFGFAVVQKLTAVFFFPALLILIAIKKTDLHSKISMTLLLFLPIFIFGMVNFASLDFPFTGDLTEIKNVFLRAKSSESIISFEEFSPQESTGFTEEVGRYSGFSQNFFTRISSLLLSKEIPFSQKQFVDLGFWFFVFLPFFGCEIFRQRKSIKRSDFENLFLVIVFFGFWLLLGHGVPWYGFPALVIFGIYFLKFISPKSFLIAVLTLSIITGIVSRLQNFTPNPAVASVSWAAFPNVENEKRLERKIFPTEISIAGIINQNLNTKIWRIGTLMKFWISNPENRIFDDPQLDYFSIIYSEKNSQIPIDFWYKNNFKFIILDRGTTSIEKNKKGSLHQKFKKFETFARLNLKILHLGESAILFEIP